MDALTFLANIINSLVWPLVATIAIVIYRVPITQVILSLKRLKYQELELDFGKEVAELKSEVEQVSLPQGKEATRMLELPEDKRLQSQVEQIASISPASAVALAWTAVESELQKAILRLAISPDYPAHVSPVRQIEILSEHNYIDIEYIDIEIFQILQRMRSLRNKAVHMAPTDAGISIEDAIEYGRLTEKVLTVLQSLHR